MKERIVIIGSGAFLASSNALTILHSLERDEVEIIDIRAKNQSEFKEPIKFEALNRFLPNEPTALALPDEKNFTNGKKLPFKKRKK